MTGGPHKTPLTDDKGAPRDSVIALLGLPDGEWSWAAADAEAREANEALQLFADLFPLIQGDGLAEYLSNLASEVTQTLADYDGLRAILGRVHDALDPDGAS